MIRVLHVYKDYFPVEGGIENHIRWLAEASNQTGEVEARVLVTNTGRRSWEGTIRGVQVTKAGRLLTIASAPISFGLFTAIQRIPADLVHLHFPYPIGELAYLFGGRDRKMVLTYHSDIVRQRSLLMAYKPFLSRVLAKAQRIIVGSEPYLHSSPYLRPVADKAVVIPFGLDSRPFKRVDQEKVAALRRRFGSSIVLFVGRLRYYKGLEYLIRAMSDLEARLVIVGTGGVERQLRLLAAQLKLDHKVVFAGRVSEEELPSYYHACDVFCLPSTHRSEAFGAAQVEAMACGKPIVCTELGTGTSFVNRHGETGFVVPPRDVEALTQALIKLLDDAELRDRLGQGARQRFLQEFTLEKMVQRTVQLYREIC